MNLSKRNLFIYGGVAVVVIVLALALWILPQWQSAAYRAKFNDEEVKNFPAEQKIQYERNVADIEDKTRLTLAQIIGGLALLSGLYFTYQNVKTAQENLRVTEEGKLTERFSNAVELLGSEKLDVRLGGIYALERIARDSQKDHWTVMEVLTAFVRENAPYNPNKKKDSPELPNVRPREDIQAIVTVIGRRKWTETETQRLNLKRVNLAGCVLWYAKFIIVELSESNLSGADLMDADLYGANLTEADLSGANLSGADLGAANLFGADLIGATLFKANLIRAELCGANLDGANLEGANLELHQTFQSKNYEKAKFYPELEKELKEWQAKQAEEKAGAGEDSSENQSVSS